MNGTDNKPPSDSDLIAALEALSPFLPEGSIDRIAWDKGVELIKDSLSFKHTLTAPGDPISTPEEIERARKMFRDFNNSRALIAETGANLPAFSDPILKIPVNVRLRCPTAEALTGPTFYAMFGELPVVEKFGATVCCEYCSETHRLTDENAVVVPYTLEQIAKANKN